MPFTQIFRVTMSVKEMKQSLMMLCAWATDMMPARKIYVRNSIFWKEQKWWAWKNMSVNIGKICIQILSLFMIICGNSFITWTSIWTWLNLTLFLFKVYFMCMSALLVCVYLQPIHACRGQKRALNSLELELQMAESWAKAISVLNHWGSSPS